MDEPFLQNPYKTLNVPKDATLATIRSAHRKLVLACHPDKVLDESAKKIKAEQFHQVQQAYEILSDENRRARHDEKARLAELRAEMHTERGPPRRAESYQSPRYAGSSPVFEMRNGRMYEERVPGRSHAYEEDIFASKFADSRPSAKKFDEMYPDVPPLQKRHTSGSGRQQEERRRMREVEEERERREKDDKKAKAAAARDEKERRRAKERRRDMQAKSSRKFTYMDTDASDSEVDDRRQSNKREATPPKRRYDDRRKSDRDEPRRSSKREDLRRERDGDGDSLEDMVNAAQEYMSKSRETIEIEPRSRPSRKRTDSNLDRTPIVPPILRPVESRRRSSDRERSDKERSGRSGGESDRRDDRRRGGRGSKQPSPVRRDSGKKDKKFREPEIVEPISSGRKTSLPFGLDPKGLKDKISGSSSARKEPSRSSTHHQTAPEPAFKHPGLRRAETMPINKMHRNEPIPLKSSHLKNAKAPSDDDSSSSDDSDTSEETNETPEIRPRNTMHTYKVNKNSEAHSPHTIYAEPEDYDSPKPRRPAGSPNLGGRGSSNRSPPNRSMSYNVGEDRSFSHPPVTPRGDSGRGAPPTKNRGSGRSSKKLFGEFDKEDDLAKSAKVPKMSSPRMSPADIRYLNKPRRSSEDVDHDAVPWSLNNRSRGKPSYQRRESVY